MHLISGIPNGKTNFTVISWFDHTGKIKPSKKGVIVKRSKFHKIVKRQYRYSLIWFIISAIFNSVGISLVLFNNIN